MSQTEAAPPKKKKKRGKKKLLLILFTLLLVGGGGAGAGLYAMGQIPLGENASEEDSHLPQLVVRDGVSETAAAHGRARARRGSPDPRIFEASYIPLEANFTSNLRGGEGFVQIGLGVSTFYGEPVIEHLHTHEMAVRSAILMTLSEQDPAAITTLQGKQALKQALRNAINEALTIREGFGGIDDVYFTSFVTQ
jgi:flagellar protein FliL